MVEAVNARRDKLGLKVLCRDNPAVYIRFKRVHHLSFVPDTFHLDLPADMLLDKQYMQPLNASRVDQFKGCVRRSWLTNNVITGIWGQCVNCIRVVTWVSW